MLFFKVYLSFWYFLVTESPGFQVVEVPNTSWEDIGGLENVKRELQEVCDYEITRHVFENFDSITDFLGVVDGSIVICIYCLAKTWTIKNTLIIVLVDKRA